MIKEVVKSCGNRYNKTEHARISFPEEAFRENVLLSIALQADRKRERAEYFYQKAGGAFCPESRKRLISETAASYS